MKSITASPDMSLAGDFDRKPISFHALNSVRSKIVSLWSYTFDRPNKQSTKIVDELIQQNVLKDRLLAIVCHDVRSPLDSLKAFLPLLVDQKLNQEELRHVVSGLDHQVEQVSHLLENMLRWIKGHSTEIKPHFEHLSLRHIVQETVGLFLPGARGKQIQIEVNILKDSVVVADEQMIRLILRNLTSNAIKFCKAGDYVSVSAREEQGMLAISVCDTGQGIKSEDIQKLFALSHVSTRGTNSEVGMGLGLTLCKEFVEKMGGEINVTSAEGKGSCFEFTVHTSTSATPEFLNFIESTRQV